MLKKVFNLIQKFSFAFVLVNLISISAPNANPAEPVSALSISGSGGGYIKAGQVDSCSAYFEDTTQKASCRDGEVPTPAATWLFFLVLIAFVGLSNKRKL